MFTPPLSIVISNKKELNEYYTTLLGHKFLIVCFALSMKSRNCGIKSITTFVTSAE